MQVIRSKEWARKIVINDDLTIFGNHTLITIYPKAIELYSKLGEGKELLEKIGHYLVFDRYLRKMSTKRHDGRYGGYYGRLGGSRREIDGLECSMRRFNEPKLELHVFNFVHQLRQARKVLKALISTKERKMLHWYLQNSVIRF